MNFFAGEALEEEAINQGLNSRLRRSRPFRTRLQTAFGAYVGARTVAHFKQASVFQFGISFDDSVRTNHQFLSESPDAGKEIAITKDSRFNGVADLIDYL